MTATYRLDPQDQQGESRDFTVSEVSLLLRHQYRAVPAAQVAAFSMAFPDIAYLFMLNPQTLFACGKSCGRSDASGQSEAIDS